MKTKTLFALSLFVVMSSLLLAQSGGPDTYGYTWKNNTAPQGPVYNWINIKTTGTQVTGFTDDNSIGSFNLNWNFHYYWSDYNKVWIGSNGWIAFQNIGNIAAPFPAIPVTGGPNNYLAPIMCDLTFLQKDNSPVPGASVWYWTNNVDTLIIQYDSVAYYVEPSPSYSGRYTFQIILSGVDSSITFQYKLAQNGTVAYSMTQEHLTTGIENSTGLIGLQVLRDAFPTASTAVKFYYPKAVTYQVFDVTPTWNQNSDNAGFFVPGPYGKPLQFTTNIANTGNQNVNNINVNGQIFDANLNQVWNSNYSVTSLTAGTDTVLTYPSSYSANAPGTFIYRSATTLTGDMNPNNDVNDVEMVVVGTTQPTVNLSFSTATTTTTFLKWQGGNGGAGVYFIPPFYPATVLSIDYFIVGDAGKLRFLAKLLDDNGPNNTPGTTLDSIMVPNDSVVAKSYNTIKLTTPYVITSGGVYAGWLMINDSIGIGTDRTLPLSNRNYEVIGNSWAAYRDNSTENFMIRLNIKGSNTVSTNNLNENVFELSQNYPNPSVNYTIINFTLQKRGEVQFTIKNILGQEIDAINLGNQSAGTHSLKVNTTKFNPGIYFYSLKLGNNEITKKMIVGR